MEKKQWVQHISGMGEKYEVLEEERFSFVGKWIKHPVNPSAVICLPKSEYVPCDPPEVWRDVTEFIEASTTPGNWINTNTQREVLGVETDGYRLRKVQLMDACEGNMLLVETGKVSGLKTQWAFIVEQKVTQ